MSDTGAGSAGDKPKPWLEKMKLRAAEERASRARKASAAEGTVVVTGSVAESGPDRRYDLLAVSDRKTALAPSLIWTSPEGGQLRLSGLPLKKTIGSYPTVALEICCMAQTPQERGGVTLPGAVTRQLPIGGKERDDAFKNVFQIARQTLANGEHVLAHCMVGRHRGGTAGCLLRAILAEEDWDQTVAEVKKIRPTLDIPGAMKDGVLRKWVSDTLGKTKLHAPLPFPVAYAAADRSSIHLQTDQGLTLCAHKQREEKAKRLVNPYTTTS